MRVMEVYDACQGEGQLIGQPSTFVRTFGCNLRCSWCDTYYSINAKEWKAYAEQRGETFDILYKELSVEELYQRLSQRHIVITGGEPTIQDDLVPLIEECVQRGKYVTIETNGTIYPEGLDRMEERLGFQTKDKVLWSISPKLASASENGGRAWFDLDVVKKMTAKLNSQIKFVIASPIDLLEAEAFVKDLPARFSRPIVLQPEGSIVKEGRDRYLYELGQLQSFIAHYPFWKAYDVRVLPQLHTLIHGQRRFV